MDHQTNFSLTDVLNTDAHPNGRSLADKLDDIVQAIGSDDLTVLSVSHTLTKDISVSTSSIADMVSVPPNDVLNTDISNLCKNPIDNHFHSSVVESANNMELSVDSNTRHSPSHSYNTGKLPQFCKCFGNRVIPPYSSMLENCAVSPNSIQFEANSDSNTAALTPRKSVLLNNRIYESIDSRQTRRTNGDRAHKDSPRNYRNKNKLTLEEVELEMTERNNKQLKNKLRALENEKMFVLSLLRQRGIFT